MPGIVGEPTTRYIFISKTLILCISGSVRDAGGSMGKRQAAQEEQYFRQEQQKQIEEYKEKQKEAAQKANSQK